MVMLRIIIISLGLLVLSAEVSMAASMRLELAHDKVDITTGFDGAQIVVFGMTDRDGGDVAVTLRGPETTVVVRRKERFLGAWMNRESMEFRRVPSYYDYALSRSIAAINAPEAFKEHQIRVLNLDFYAEDAAADPAMVQEFRDALTYRMRVMGLFSVRPKVVQFLKPGFFKATFNLPAGVPTGVYSVEAFLLRDGQVAARDIKSLQVGQVGFNARVYLFANSNPWLYGGVTILIAVFSGWAAFTFLRRD